MRHRKIFIAGNWKMNMDRTTGVALARSLASQIGRVEEVDVAIFPPAPLLSSVHEAISHTRIALGGQNMHFEKSGAFTGEVSGAMLLDSGCTHVILGHSERRQIFGETDELINRKVISALAQSIKPILCVGETLEERQAGKTNDVVGSQLRYGLVGVRPEQMREVTIAYEPVWAIGTGQVATPHQAEEVHAFLRDTLTHVCGTDLAQSIRIQYGGSVKPDNAAGLLSQPNVDGALVGGACLKAEDFSAIVQAGQEIHRSS
ncbi:triose-phosphate isomerase [bacterium]|nr:triose-phosphate isomerase [bacterium]